MQVFGFSGCKTETAVDLVTAALPLLRAHGLTLSVLLEGPKDFDLDQPGKDSYKHRAAGALEVAISSTQRWALLHEESGPTTPSLHELTAQFDGVDMVLVLGFEAAFRAALAQASDPAIQMQHLQLSDDLDAAGLAALILGDAAPATPALTQQA